MAVAPSAHAVDSLGVGWRGTVLRWTDALESSRLISFSPDSIWMWNVVPNSNLGPGVVEREGFTLFRGELGTTFLDGAKVLYDGDETTAFNPDEFVERTELERTTPLYIDLGSTFRVNRIRLYPRLDEKHKPLFPRAFSLGTNDGLEGNINLLDRPFESVVSFFPSYPNREPVIERRFPSREVRYLRFEVRENRPWELAELEVYSDGTLPMGEFVSRPVFAQQGPRPLWGRVRYDGGDITDLSVTVQTRTGADNFPLLYYRLTGIGSDREEVSKAEYAQLDSMEQGPILPNPAWSTWETVTDGLVRSPGTRPYIQYRILMTEPATVLKRFIIEYINPPIAEELTAEIVPILVEAGRERRFTLSLRTRMRVNRSDGTPLANGDSGFQSLRIRSAAPVTAVEKVMVDDRETDFSARFDEGEGATVRLRRRVLQDGTFIQIVLRSILYRDATRFDVQAVDQRLIDGEQIEVYQSAREEDIDPVSLGGTLVVRLDANHQSLSLLEGVEAWPAVFTPNGDGINESFQLSYALLKLTRPVEVGVEIFDLSGRRLKRIFAGEQIDGGHAHSWDGRDERGDLVPPGAYLYRLRVEADAGSAQRTGIVGVAY